MEIEKYFWSQVKKQLNLQNTNYEWLYQVTKIPKATFATWKANGRVPRVDEAYKIASCLGVQLEYLVDENFDGVHAVEVYGKYRDILEQLEKLDREDLFVVWKLLEGLTALSKTKKTEMK